MSTAEKSLKLLVKLNRLRVERGHEHPQTIAAEQELRAWDRELLKRRSEQVRR